MSTSDLTARARPPLHLAVALRGAGWHPAARPADVHTPALRADLLRTAERGRLDVVPVEEGPAVLAHGWEAMRLAARVADTVCVTPGDAFGAEKLVELVRMAERDVGRSAPLRVLADLVVLLDRTPEAAHARIVRLDRVERLCSDAAVVATDPSGLADLMLDWRDAGVDGFRLRPAVLPTDLDAVVDHLVPELRRRGAYRTAPVEPVRVGSARPVRTGPTVTV